MSIIIPLWTIWFSFNMALLALLAWWVWCTFSDLGEKHRDELDALTAEHQERIAALIDESLKLQEQLASHATLWLVGRHVRGNHWDVQGVFSSRELAVKACKNVRYFLFVLDLDQELPEESATPFKLEYPKEVD